MLKILLIVFTVMFAFAFMADSAHAAPIHFDCKGIKENGKLCNKKLVISNTKGYTTTCTGCKTKYIFDGAHVVDEYGNIIL